ncbi:MAG: plasmid stabilization protein [Candidatus Cloacimonetes bacterium]|nr:plasmid stabilization protein [Candidatus Cloacimonadota bacterium]MBL7085951.1 plasmid stabilization protein [Candidatus Cloacimonadota bacterium]
MKKFLKKHPELENRIETIHNLLEINYQDHSLKLHKLHGKLKDFHSVSVNYKFRIILILMIIADKIILVDIGTHAETY